MKWVDLGRLCLVMALGYGVAAIRSIVFDESVHIDGGDLFLVALLMTTLWAIRDGEEPKA